MAPGPCPSCGSLNPPGTRYCVHCGGPYSTPRGSAPVGPWATPFRLQVDPLDPTPGRDVRWVMIVLGIALVIVAIILLVFSAIVSSAVSAGCAGPNCSSVDPGIWLEWLGLPFLLLGAVLLGVGLVGALR